jgi:hypothetical protein
LHHSRIAQRIRWFSQNGFIPLEEKKWEQMGRGQRVFCTAVQKLATSATGYLVSHTLWRVKWIGLQRNLAVDTLVFSQQSIPFGKKYCSKWAEDDGGLAQQGRNLQLRRRITSCCALSFGNSGSDYSRISQRIRWFSQHGLSPFEKKEGRK